MTTSARIKTPAVMLLISDVYGTNIPLQFIHNFSIVPDFTGEYEWEGVSQENIDGIRLGLNSEAYWEHWDSILSNATYTKEGHTWRLYQDGDLWAYCNELMTDEEKKDWWGFE